MTTKPIRILVADDHTIVRAGLCELLSLEPDLCVVGEAATGDEALALAARLKPDVLLLDHAMPGLTGLEVLAQLTERYPTVQCIILTGFADPHTFFQALELGAAGYLLKTMPYVELAQAVRSARHNGFPLDPQLAPVLIHRIHQSANNLPTAHPSLSQLTLREHEILALVARGCTNAEIARKLVISPYTVGSHICSILQKLDLTSRTQAALFYLSQRTGLPTWVGKPVRKAS